MSPVSRHCPRSPIPKVLGWVNGVNVINIEERSGAKRALSIPLDKHGVLAVAECRHLGEAVNPVQSGG